MKAHPLRTQSIIVQLHLNEAMNQSCKILSFNNLSKTNAKRAHLTFLYENLIIRINVEPCNFNKMSYVLYILKVIFKVVNKKLFQIVIR